MRLSSISLTTVFLIFSFILTGCGGSNGVVDNNDDNTITVPTVVSTTPSNGEEKAFAVPSITVTFSTEMDGDSLTTSTFTLIDNDSESISGNVSYDSESMTATFTPNQSLEIQTIHTATIANTVKDTNGNELEEEYSWQFTTDGFFFVVLSDVHVRLPGNPDDPYYDNAGNIANLQAAINTINTNYSNASFVIVTGDLVGCLFSEDPDDYLIGGDNPAERYKSIMDELDMPYYSVLGNHDYQKGFDAEEAEGITTSDINAIESVWLKVLNIDPYYSFLSQGFRFVILNSNRGDSRNTLCPRSSIEAFCTGSFDDDQMDWFEDEMSMGDPALVFFHHPIGTDDESTIWSPVGESFLVTETDRFYDIAASYNDTIEGIFVGHGHVRNEDTFSTLIPVNSTAPTGDHFGEADNMNIVSVNTDTKEIEVIENQ